MKFVLVLICCILIPSTISDELSEKDKDDESSEKTSSPKVRVKKSSVKPGKFEDDCLKAHNEYRIKHGVPKLVLSKEICAYSKEWADHLAATDSFKHRKEDEYGENLYRITSSDPNCTITGNVPVDKWYREIKDYVFGKEPTTGQKTGHFSQVIWKESKSLGCAWARSKSGKIVVVANYDPIGNVIGKFAQNVPPPKK